MEFPYNVRLTISLLNICAVSAVAVVFIGDANVVVVATADVNANVSVT